MAMYDSQWLAAEGHGEQIGWKKGYEAGWNEAINKGYNQGVEAAEAEWRVSYNRNDAEWKAAYDRAVHYYNEHKNGNDQLRQQIYAERDAAAARDAALRKEIEELREAYNRVMAEGGAWKLAADGLMVFVEAAFNVLGRDKALRNEVLFASNKLTRERFEQKEVITNFWQSSIVQKKIPGIARMCENLVAELRASRLKSSSPDLHKVS